MAIALSPQLSLFDGFWVEGAIADNEISRIYLGVHWKFDATDGKEVGDAVARKVVEAFKPPMY